MAGQHRCMDSNYIDGHIKNLEREDGGKFVSARVIEGIPTDGCLW